MTYFNHKQDRFFFYYSPKFKIMADKLKAKKLSIKSGRTWTLINLVLISITIAN